MRTMFFRVNSPNARERRIDLYPGLRSRAASEMTNNTTVTAVIQPMSVPSGSRTSILPVELRGLHPDRNCGDEHDPDPEAGGPGDQEFDELGGILGDLQKIRNADLRVM